MEVCGEESSATVEAGAILYACRSLLAHDAGRQCALLLMPRGAERCERNDGTMPKSIIPAASFRLKFQSLMAFLLLRNDRTIEKL